LAELNKETESIVSNTSETFDSSIPVLTDIVAPSPSHDFIDDESIPVLTDVVVAGKPSLARAAGLGARAGVEYDADLIGERLRGRMTGFLTGGGREVIETRCREVLQEHSSWLVHQITREVALALETELSEWVHEAVREELARQTGAR
jgi:Protein of unknown function (DUF2486)